MNKCHFLVPFHKKKKIPAKPHPLVHLKSHGRGSNHVYFPKKKIKSILHVEQHILFLLILSLPVRRPPAPIYLLHARLPICPPACPKPALLCYKKQTEQNECDCIIFVTLCSSNCLYTKKSNKYQKTDYNYVVIFRWV